MANTRGVTGYGGSSLTITYGGTYNGGGPAGFSGGTAIVLCPTKRGYEFLRHWVDTTCDQYEQGISGRLRMPVDFSTFFNNDSTPPPAILNTDTVLAVLSLGLRTITLVMFLESWKAHAATDEGCPLDIRGRSDGPFTIA